MMTHRERVLKAMAHDEALPWQIDLTREFAEKLCNSSKCGDLESTMPSLASKLGVDTLCVTCAADPAVMLWHGAISYGSTFKVDIEDTVGAGDTFFASMIDSLLHPDFDPCPAITRATALGAWVASRPGAQPEYDNSVPDQARGN